MNRLLGITLVAGIGAASLADATPAAHQTQSVSEGIYTNTQANRGQVLYHDVCESCHSPDLAGGKVVPEIVGPTFVTRWSGQTIGQLFERILVSMPEDDPSSVSRQAKADIIAFILRANEFPVRDTELPDRIEDLKALFMTVWRPSTRSAENSCGIRQG